MKLFFKLIVLLAFIWSSNTFGQSKGFSYQALILDISTIEVPSADIQPQIPLDNEPVGLRISIIRSINGVETIVYVEERIVRTDDNGMISIIVGPDQDGVIVGSSALNFDEIDWNGEKMYLNVELNIVSSTSGFFPLEKQEIVYMPHPSNPLEIYSDEFELLLITDKKPGNIVWVKDADGSTNDDGTTNPSLFILNELDTWVPVLNDYDPENELKLITVADDLERNTRFSPPQAGDQVFNLEWNRIEVYNGSNWITILSSINLKATNGLSINSTNPDEPEVELGGALTQPATTIAASPVNTLAITGLDAVTDLNDEVILSDPTSGVLKKITFDDIFLNKAIEILSDPSAIPLLIDKKQGDLIWVQDANGSTNADGTSNPSLFILIAEPNTWAPVIKDFDPENELYVISASTIADRDINPKFSPIPAIGDQVYIIDQDIFQIYNGTVWVTINLKASNGLSINTTNPDVPEVELGGSLNKATSIATTTTETLAITGLDSINNLNDRVLVLDSITGVLKKISFDDIFLNKAITILADAAGIASLIDKNQGDLIWVKNYDGNINPTLLIFDDSSDPLNPLFPWVPVIKDFDPENELYIISVATLADRDIDPKFLPIPAVGDQVYIIDQELLQVYNGTAWITINLNASNGLSINATNPGAPEVELGGALNKATSIATTATETLAITGLEPVTALNYDVIVSDPSDPTSPEVLKKISFDDIFLNKAITILEDPSTITTLTPDKNQGDLIWVKNYDDNSNPTLLIFGDTIDPLNPLSPWVPVSNLRMTTVNDIVERNAFFGNPQIGDQVFITGTLPGTEEIQVWDGIGWKNIISYARFNADNGINVASGVIKLGGDLTDPLTTITTFPNASPALARNLAITGLEPVTALNDDVVLSDPVTGVLKKIRASDFISETSVKIVDNTSLLLPASRGALAWVLNYIVPNNPTLFIFNSGWKPLNTDPIVFSNLAERVAIYTSPEIGDLVYLEDCNCIQVFTGNPAPFDWDTLISELNFENSVSNGLTYTQVGGLKLGGKLIETTEIDLNTYNLAIKGLRDVDPLAGDDHIVFSNEITNVISRKRYTDILGDVFPDVLNNELILPSPAEAGQMVWVRTYKGKTTPTLLIYDNTITTGTPWIPVNNDFDPDNEKLIIVANNAVRLTQLGPTPNIGTQVFNKASNSIEVYDGTDWVILSGITQIFNNETVIATNLELEGSLVWVRAYNGNPIPTLLIYDNTVLAWVPVNKKQIIVDFAANRATQFPTPIVGNQFFNLDTNSIDVYDGAVWIVQSTSAKTEIFDTELLISPSLNKQNTTVLVRSYKSEAVPTLLIYDAGAWIPAANYLEAANGLTIDPASGKVELGGVLNKSTTIEATPGSATAPAITLAIKGLVPSASITDVFVVADPFSGVLSTKTAAAIFKSTFAERFDNAAGGNQILVATGGVIVSFNDPGIPDPANYSSTPTEITVLKAGTYRVTYRVTANVQTWGGSTTIDFEAYKRTAAAIPRTTIDGSVSSSSYNFATDKVTVTATKNVTLIANEIIGLQATVLPTTSTTVIQTVPNGSSLLIERIK